MITKELTETATEINEIFDNLPNDILSKIPISVRSFFKDIASTSYFFKYDIKKDLKDQEIRPRTKGILALLYRDYICDEIQKKEFNNKYKKFLEKQEKIKSEKYNVNDLFKSSQNRILEYDNIPIIYEKKRWYTKILNWFKTVFLK